MLTVVDIHDLAAAYALDALDEDERVRFEAHLRGCADCRAEVDSLRALTFELALGAAADEPPAGLREHILTAARAERTNVVPFRSRRSLVPALASAVAVAAAVGLVSLGVWASSLRHSLAHERAAVAVLGDPHARRVPVRGASGALVVSRTGEAALAVDLPKPPAHKRYEIWVMRPAAHRAGLFSERPTKLSLHVRPGDLVAVTLERAEGVDAPTSKPLLTARA